MNVQIAERQNTRLVIGKLSGHIFDEPKQYVSLQDEYKSS